MSVSDTTAAGMSDAFVHLDTAVPIWDRFFSVAPLVLVGTRQADGSDDIAPKHMVSPIGWQNFFGFVCTPSHATYQNVQRDGHFAVTYPKPTQWLQTSLAASPRCDDDSKPALQWIDTRRSRRFRCPVLIDGYLYLECSLERIVDDFGNNSLIVGRITAAEADPACLRDADRDDRDLLIEQPLLAYIAPGRFACISDSQALPLPAGMRR